MESTGIISELERFEEAKRKFCEESLSWMGCGRNLWNPMSTRLVEGQIEMDLTRKRAMEMVEAKMGGLHLPVFLVGGPTRAKFILLIKQNFVLLKHIFVRYKLNFAARLQYSTQKTDGQAAVGIEKVKVRMAQLAINKLLGTFIFSREALGIIDYPIATRLHGSLQVILKYEFCSLCDRLLLMKYEGEEQRSE